MRSKRWINRAVLAAVGIFLMVHNSSATENGGTAYPLGNENYLVGALPPPGFYTQLFVDYFHSDTLRDNHGDKVAIPGGFEVNALALAPRVIWVTKQKILGGDLVVHAIIPLVDLDVKVAGKRDSSTGLGDILSGAAVGYHVSPKFHWLTGVDFFLPTGLYDKNKVANTSRNYWTFEPLVAASYVQPAGINADLKVQYDFNLENTDTKYTSGQELHADYALGWGFGNGWVLGVGGYAYQQVTDDRDSNGTVHDNNGRAFGIGPNIKYDNGKGWILTAKWQDDIGVRNRADGQNIKIRVIIPF